MEDTAEKNSDDSRTTRQSARRRTSATTQENSSSPSDTSSTPKTKPSKRNEAGSSGDFTPRAPLSERQQLALLRKLTRSDTGSSPTWRRTVNSYRRRAVASIERRNCRGETALHVAAIAGDWLQVKQLVQRGARVNTCDFAGWTPLHEASNHGWDKVARVLLESGADVSPTGGPDNFTPLHDAVVNSHPKIVHLLLKYGADPAVRTISGKTPRDLTNDSEILHLLDLAATPLTPKSDSTNRFSAAAISTCRRGLFSSSESKMKRVSGSSSSSNSAPSGSAGNNASSTDNKGSSRCNSPVTTTATSTPSTSAPSVVSSTNTVSENTKPSSPRLTLRFQSIKQQQQQPAASFEGGESGNAASGSTSPVSASSSAAVTSGSVVSTDQQQQLPTSSATKYTSYSVTMETKDPYDFESSSHSGATPPAVEGPSSSTNDDDGAVAAGKSLSVASAAASTSKKDVSGGACEPSGQPEVNESESVKEATAADSDDVNKDSHVDTAAGSSSAGLSGAATSSSFGTHRKRRRSIDTTKEGESGGTKGKGKRGSSGALISSTDHVDSSSRPKKVKAGRQNAGKDQQQVSSSTSSSTASAALHHDPNSSEMNFENAEAIPAACSSSGDRKKSISPAGGSGGSGTIIDAADDNAVSGVDSGGCKSPKVPPLKIVLPTTSTGAPEVVPVSSTNAAQSSGSGETKGKPPLPYVVNSPGSSGGGGAGSTTTCCKSNTPQAQSPSSLAADSSNTVDIVSGTASNEHMLALADNSCSSTASSITSSSVAKEEGSGSGERGGEKSGRSCKRDKNADKGCSKGSGSGEGGVGGMEEGGNGERCHRVTRSSHRAAASDSHDDGCPSVAQAHPRKRKIRNTRTSQQAAAAAAASGITTTTSGAAATTAPANGASAATGNAAVSAATSGSGDEGTGSSGGLSSAGNVPTTEASCNATTPTCGANGSKRESPLTLSAGDKTSNAGSNSNSNASGGMNCESSMGGIYSTASSGGSSCIKYNSYEMFLNIRRQVEKRRATMRNVHPKTPHGFKNYLLNRCSYALEGNPSSRLSVSLIPPPPTLTGQLKDLFCEQEKERYKLRLQHLIEREKVVLAAEQECLREHARAARQMASQPVPLSACTVLRDAEIYDMFELDSSSNPPPPPNAATDNNNDSSSPQEQQQAPPPTPTSAANQNEQQEEDEQEEKDQRSRFNARLLMSWLQDIYDKWEKIKERMLLRHHSEAESLHAVQKMDWEWKAKEVMAAEQQPKGVATPPDPAILLATNAQQCVPLVRVNDDFDVLPYITM